MLWQTTIGDHSFLRIDGTYTNVSQARQLLVERAVFNYPIERCGGYPLLGRLAFGVRRSVFGVRVRVRARARARAPSDHGLEMLFKNECSLSDKAGLQRRAPSAQKLLAIELVNATGTMTITVVPRPGAVWISNLPPISEAL